MMVGSGVAAISPSCFVYQMVERTAERNTRTNHMKTMEFIKLYLRNLSCFIWTEHRETLQQKVFEMKGREMKREQEILNSNKRCNDLWKKNSRYIMKTNPIQLNHRRCIRPSSSMNKRPGERVLKEVN